MVYIEINGILQDQRLLLDKDGVAFFEIEQNDLNNQEEEK